jgi:hypothetical protein
MRREVIHATRDINKLPVTEAFAHLFYGAVNVSKVGFNFFYCFAIQRNDKMKYTMGSWVLGPYINDKITFTGLPGGGRITKYFSLSVQIITALSY